MSSFKPVTVAKGGKTKVVSTAGALAAAKFDGWKVAPATKAAPAKS